MTTARDKDQDLGQAAHPAPPSYVDPNRWLLSDRNGELAHENPPGASRPRPRVIVADDDATLVEITSLILHFSGYEVTAAEDGEQAWCAYLERGCDLLLTDQDMPRLSGLELIERIRSHGDPVPVVLASGRMGADDIPPLLRGQIDAVLSKPFASNSLLETIRGCLRPRAF